MKLTESINVLVTGVGGGGNGEQLMKALRLAKTPYTIIGSDISPFSIGLYQADFAYTIPPANSNQYIATVLAICKKHSIQAILAGSEPELLILSANRQLFLDLGILFVNNSHEVISLCNDKWKTYQFLRQRGFTVPDSYAIDTLDDILNINADMFPLIVKPSSGGGSRHTYIAQDFAELQFFCTYILQDGYKVVVQEYVGNGESEFTVGILHTLDGHFIDSIAVKRNLTSGLSVKLKVKNRTSKSELSDYLVVSSGYSQGIIDRFSAITAECEQIALALGSKGPLNIQCRFHKGKIYTFEINPRLSGTSSLRALVGFNEPDTLIRHHLMDEPLSSPINYDGGYIMRGLVECLIPFGKEKLPFPGNQSIP